MTNIIHDRACVIRYQSQNGEVLSFASLYLPSQGSQEDLRTVLDEISEIVDSRDRGSHVILLGDFNGDIGCYGGPRSSRVPTQRGRYIMDFLIRHNMIATNMQAMSRGPVDTFNSHNGKSTIDYIVIPTYLEDRIIDCRVSGWNALNTSDHLDVHMTLAVNGIANVVEEPEVPGRIKWESGDVKYSYSAAIRPHLYDLQFRISTAALTPGLIDHYFAELTKIIHDATSNLTRTRYVPHLKPYWNEELTRLKKVKVDAYRRWVSGGRPRAQNDPLMVDYKTSKKAFANSLRRLSREYENEEVCNAVKLAEFNRNSFWRLVKRCRNTKGSSNISIKRQDGLVVNEVSAVLEVWRNHFANLGTPKDKPNFDEDHFRFVTEFARRQNEARTHDDEFLNTPFTVEDVREAIKNLNRGKAAGYDKVTAEHICYADEIMVNVLFLLYNAILDFEYIPECFRTGIQIPLFKGKDLDALDPNSYRGITLLSSFNKTFEILVWQRLKDWWMNERIISDLQGACKSGLSCIHTAFLLQETLATSLENNDQCFVAFFDVAKAFDTVWIDGLFKQVFDIGITGKTWRLLYRSYVDFKCRVRIGSRFSEPYELLCGIHQGGYLSLLKYTIFINSLLVNLRDSGLCAKIYRTPCTPLGYADDLATCCLTKRKTDSVMLVVYQHGCTWRYDFNARKSGVLVFGETERRRRINAKNRSFKLGPAIVKEVAEYDHVGIRTSVLSDSISGLEERVGKARRTLNAMSGLGIRRSGLNIATCNIFWTIVVPIACELWHIDGRSINILETFQSYAGKRIQRFHPRSPNICV